MCSNSELDPCGEDMIPLSFHTVKPDGQAQIVPNQSVKASYATAVGKIVDISDRLLDGYPMLGEVSTYRKANKDIIKLCRIVG